MVFERAGEFSGPGKAGLQGGIGDPFSGRYLEKQRCAFQPKRADMTIQRFARDRLKNSVEVEGGKARYPR